MMKLRCRTFRCLTDLLQKTGQHGLFCDESQLVGVGHSKTDLVSAFEKARVVHPLAVDKRAVPAAAVLNLEALRRLENLCMTARDAIVEQHQIVIALASQGEDGAANLHVALISGSVLTDQKMGKGIGHRQLETFTMRSTRLPQVYQEFGLQFSLCSTEGLNWR